MTSTVTENVSALELTEIELNPPGEDRENEWLELYSPQSISLEGYTLVNGKGKTFNLSGELNGYRRFTVPGNWLVNTNASVFLLQGSELIQQVLLLRDSFDDQRAWSYCDSEWVFIDSTPQQENGCGDSEEIIDEEEQEPEPPVEEEDSETEETPIQTSFTPQPTTINNSVTRMRPKIVVSSQTTDLVKGEIITSEGFIRDSVIYVFSGLCLALIILLLLRKT